MNIAIEEADNDELYKPQSRQSNHAMDGGSKPQSYLRYRYYAWINRVRMRRDVNTCSLATTSSSSLLVVLLHATKAQTPDTVGVDRVSNGGRWLVHSVGGRVDVAWMKLLVWYHRYNTEAINKQQAFNK